MAVDAQEITPKYAVYNGDCMEPMRSLPKERIHLSVYSPPFGGLYHYSSSPRDLSNNDDYEKFFNHYFFVVRELHRLTVPGRMTAVHCADIPSGNTGDDHMIDFPGDIIRLHIRCRNETCRAPKFERLMGKCGHGWFRYIARYSIWKEPLAVRNRTMAKNLAHKQIVEDSSKCSVAAADTLLVFRRSGKNPIPIVHPVGLLNYAGSRKMPAELLRYRGWKGNQIENRYSHWIWRQYASAFWDDIRHLRVLPFRDCREPDDEQHVHPLQLDVIERCLQLWSNEGETVLTPFMGVGSEVYQAVKSGRRGIGVELKTSYYRQALLNIAAAETDTIEEQMSLLEESVVEPTVDPDFEAEDDPQEASV
jgi:DNA modification methylase